MFDFDLQLFSGSTKTTGEKTSSYSMSPEERELYNNLSSVANPAMEMSAKVANSMNDDYDSTSLAFNADDTQATNLTNSALGYTNQGLTGLTNSLNGTLSNDLKQNLTDSIKTTLENTTGSTLNDLANRGVINSSTLSSAYNTINNSTANAVAQNYLNALNSQSSNANSLISNSTAGLNALGTGIDTAYKTWNNRNSLLKTGADMGSTLAGLVKGTGTKTETEAEDVLGSILMGMASTSMGGTA